LMPLHTALFCESSPGPVKYAAKLLGKCSDEVRLPLCEIEDRSKKIVEAAMKKTGLIN
jgi:4-hydroxy-tetrahydrodipicolinate synthase